MMATLKAERGVEREKRWYFVFENKRHDLVYQGHFNCHGMLQVPISFLFSSILCELIWLTWHDSCQLIMTCKAMMTGNDSDTSDSRWLDTTPVDSFPMYISDHYLETKPWAWWSFVQYRQSIVYKLQNLVVSSRMA